MNNGENICLFNTASKCSAQEGRVKNMEKLYGMTASRLWFGRMEYIGIDKSSAAFWKDQMVFRGVVFQNTAFDVKKFHCPVPVPWNETVMIFVNMGAG